MGQLRHTVGCGSNEQCSQSVRQADTVRCGHAASSLCELVAVLEFSTVRYLYRSFAQCVLSWNRGNTDAFTRLLPPFQQIEPVWSVPPWPQVFSQGEYLHVRACSNIEFILRTMRVYEASYANAAIFEILHEIYMLQMVLNAECKSERNHTTHDSRDRPHQTLPTPLQAQLAPQLAPQLT